MSENVPEKWFNIKLTDFINIGRGYAFKSFDYCPEGHPIVRVTNISNANSLDLSNDVVYLEKKRVKEFQSYQLKDDDFLLVMVGATIGKHAKVTTRGKLLFLNQNMWRLSVVDEQSNSQKFAIYGLQKVIEEFLSTMQGSAREFLTQKEFEKISILVPPLPEQKKIASILTSVDEVIEKTQSQIDKLQDPKKATMNELLTKGIGHTEFKDSELGRIPKSWEVGRFDKFITLQRGHDLPLQNRLNGRVPIYGSNGMIGFHNQTNIEATGVITGRSGSIGDVYFINGKYWALNTTLFVSNFHGNDKEFIAFFLEYFDLERFSSGTGVPTLNRNDVHPQVIKFPPKEEQIRICKILNSFNKMIKNKKQKLSQIQSLKKSLMQDLLTGKVRVKVI